ncbi:unnamed protein product [Urochloa humidicola]
MPDASNPDRRMILVGNTSNEEDDGEEEYAFDEDVEATQASRWMAVARFYSGQDFKTWVIFNELSKAWGKKFPVPVRELTDNRFLVEFDLVKLWRKAIHGGPWKYRGDAIIFVPYDGLRRISEIAIDTIGLWVRIYDIPIGMMTDGFVRALGAKVGKVLEIGGAIKDYKRVKVDFPLDKALMHSV